MASILSERQKDELHKSILDYLYNAGLTASYDALRSETNHDDFNPDPKSKHAGLLEKKWTSVIRLQKKVSHPSLSIRRLVGGRPACDRLSSVVAGERGEKEEVREGERERARRELSRTSIYARGPALSWLRYFGETSWRRREGERRGRMDDQLVSLPYGHDPFVSSALFLPAGDFIVSASRDGSIKVWEVASGFCVKTFQGHSEWVRSVIPSEDGKLLASCSNDQTCRIWEVSSG